MRCYLVYLINQDHKKLTLPFIARRQVKELENETSKDELTIDHEKDPLSTKVMKEAKLYLTKIKQDSFKIKFLVDCFHASSAKRPRKKSGSSDSNTDTDTEHQDRRASSSSSEGDVAANTDRDRSTSRQRKRELKASLGVDSQ